MPRGQPFVEIIQTGPTEEHYEYYDSDDADSFYGERERERRVAIPIPPPVAPIAHVRHVQHVQPRPRARTRYTDADQRRFVAAELLSPDPVIHNRHHRSHSSSGITRGTVNPTSLSQPSVVIDINNEQRDNQRHSRYEQHSPPRAERPRSYSRQPRRVVEHRYEDDEWDEYGRPAPLDSMIVHHHSRRHSRSHSRGHNHSHSHSRSRENSPYRALDPETRAKLEKLDELDREKKAREAAELQKSFDRLKLFEEEEARRKREEELKLKLEHEEAMRVAEEARRKEEEQELKKKFLEEHKAEKAIEAAKKRKAEEEMNKLYEERVKKEFAAAGYSPDHIDAILRPKKYFKVKAEYVHPETLNYYQLPWEYDPHDRETIIIKQYISEDVQESLFSHTRRLISERRIGRTSGSGGNAIIVAGRSPSRSPHRSGRLLIETAPAVTTTELKVNDQKRDKMYLVRKKSDRRSWLFG